MLSKIYFLLAFTYLITTFSTQTNTQTPANDPEQSIKRGEVLYGAHCVSCHQSNGTGVPGVYPPLAKSDYLMADSKRAIRIVLHGLTDEIVVNGETYDEEMPAQSHLTDEQAADVLNYIRNSWGNKGNIITPEQVKVERK